MSGATRVELSVDLAGLADHLRGERNAARRIVAIAGPPGAGKSTFARRLCDELNRGEPETAAVLGMDGFHYDDRVLGARGHRARKGAPHTFDVDGLAAMLDRLRADDGKPVAVPVFDRSLEIARAGAEIIAASVRLVLVEGNYLLFDDPAWAAPRRCFDVTVMLDVPRPVLAARLAARWRELGMDEAGVRAKLDGNDLVNVDLVLSRRAPADFVVRDAG
ncbi:nucleoside/nucleotide kinase family protein [Burkholderia stagnalis]|uniref:nucleoside/nucleotide kinase family protein n=1 Tax=Burkholderia stagnalis TaxID=1503054 RepID=UPI00075B6649|nr:nucleoside/nucleotide kinase family protein [Burkholderia stagnalis]AOK56939.1 nucleoside triphosphate hydrolase [Burkholderia stagnalis]KVC67869.1 nucleoside triphosphate hydrolase [Burkholderia stagnalis]KVN17783.1 nucleoside triphosphate hydrolase [Burkholderia stagnalis]KVN23816.1 nucleoside triphosphate hydrolase [Burkholderia stagnalis]KVN83808.1 nucleoside triphosphate hydrolase [Burkholderia stagnalis]